MSFLSADEGFDFFDDLDIESSEQFCHFDDPVALQLAEYIVIFNAAQVIWEPFILKSKEPEESGLTNSLRPHDAEHSLKSICVLLERRFMSVWVEKERLFCYDWITMVNCQKTKDKK